MAICAENLVFYTCAIFFYIILLEIVIYTCIVGMTDFVEIVDDDSELIISDIEEEDE